MALKNAISLPVPKSGEVRKICHISDIHIRAGTDTFDPKVARVEEYLGVIDKIVRFLEGLEDRDSLVIVITGDIVHDNKKAGAPCIELFYRIMKKLSSVAPVWIIRGNHDYNQAAVVDQDILGSLMASGLGDDGSVTYLRDTGHYVGGNIGVGLVAIQDTLKVGDTHGRVAELPAFPEASAFDQYYQNTDFVAGGRNPLKRIALFHGDVPGVYSVDWIGKGWDWILLGDLHRMQIYGGVAENERILMQDVGDGVFKMNKHNFAVKNNHPPMAYPGSTIQQNFGETMSGHGFLMWDVESDSVTSYHVANEYGFVNARRNGEGRLEVNLSYPTNAKNIDCWIDADKAVKQQWFPKIWRLRIKNGDDAWVDAERLGIKIENMKMWTFDTGKTVEDGTVQKGTIDAELDISSFNNPDTWCKYIVDKTGNDAGEVSTFIKQPESLISGLNEGSAFGVDVGDRSMKMSKAMDEYLKAREIGDTAIHGHGRFSLCYMNWSWILCYKEGCWVNFEDMNGNVMCVGGKNGAGKTSFLECICLALYGEGFPSRASKAYSSSVICMQKPAKQRAYTSIVFEIDGVRYRIKRVFDVQSKDKSKVNAKEVVLEVLGGDDVKPSPQGKTSVGDWVKKHLGDVKTFLTSVIITQNFDGDFFAMPLAKQREYLDKQLRLDSSTALLGLWKTAGLGYEELGKRLGAMIDVKRGDLMRDDVVGVIDGIHGIDRVTERIRELDERVTGLKEGWMDVVNEGVLAKGRMALEEELSGCKSKTEVMSALPGNDNYDELLVEKGGIERELAEIKKFLGDYDEGFLNEIRDDVFERPEGEKCVADLEQIAGDLERIEGEIGEDSRSMKDIKKNIERLKERFEGLTTDRDGLIAKREQFMCIKHSEADYKEWLGKVARLEKKMGLLGVDETPVEDAIEERDRLAMLMGVKPVMPKKPKDNAKGYKRELLHEVKRNWPLMNAEIEKKESLLAEKLKGMKADDGHGYNEDCSCCLARKGEIQSRIDECAALEQEIVDLRKGSWGIENAAGYREAMEVLAWMEWCEWEENRKKWEAAVARVKELEEVGRLRDEVKRERESQERCVGIRAAYVEWKREMARVEREYQGVFDELKRDEKLLGLKKKQVELQALLDTLEEWIKWEISVKLARAGELEGRLMQVIGEIDGIKRGREMRDRIGELEQALGVVDIYDEWRVAVVELEGLRVKRAMLEERRRVREEVVAKNNRVKEEIAGMTGVLERWKAVGERLKAIGDAFVGYKDWVLGECIIPGIVERINELLGVMCRNHRNIRILVGDGGMSSPLGERIGWSMVDGVNNVPLEKASGFQRFALSLAMRIALSRLGAVGIRNRQLFIDEGFTACDAENLSMVPFVLARLLDRYDSIVIVSHLEKLQDGIDDHKIDIARMDKEGVSWIGFGERIEEIEVKRKVGRPAKNKTP